MLYTKVYIIYKYICIEPWNKHKLNISNREREREREREKRLQIERKQ